MNFPKRQVDMQTKIIEHAHDWPHWPSWPVRFCRYLGTHRK
jgi:hypothetical protein